MATKTAAIERHRTLTRDGFRRRYENDASFRDLERARARKASRLRTVLKNAGIPAEAFCALMQRGVAPDVAVALLAALAPDATR